MLTYEVTDVGYGMGFDVCTIGEDSDIGRSLRSDGEYEKNVANLLLEVENPGNYSFIDFGAHWGTFSVLMALRGCERVYAFEPDPANFYALCQTIKINDCEGHVIPYPFAALGVLGPVDLLLSDTGNTGDHQIDFSGHSYASGRTVQKVMGVPANLLLDRHTPYIAKFDIQGSEIHALRGCEGLQIDFAVIERWDKSDEELAAYFDCTRIVGDQMVCVDFKYPILNVG